MEGKWKLRAQSPLQRHCFKLRSLAAILTRALPLRVERGAGKNRTREAIEKNGRRRRELAQRRYSFNVAKLDLTRFTLHGVGAPRARTLAQRRYSFSIAKLDLTGFTVPGERLTFHAFGFQAYVGLTGKSKFFIWGVV